MHSAQPVQQQTQTAQKADAKAPQGPRAPKYATNMVETPHIFNIGKKKKEEELPPPPKIDLAPKFEKGAAIRYFDAHNGTIKAIEGIEEARRLPGVQEISIVHQVGETIGEIGSSTDRVGFVIAQGETVEDATKICEKTIAAIDFQIE